MLFTRHASTIPNEVSEMERYYQREINQKISLIQEEESGSAILSDLEMMDAAFAELKNDLKDNIDNEEVVAAMMENYRLKLEILEQIVIELEKEKGEQAL
jgi:hypothetical protein